MKFLLAVLMSTVIAGSAFGACSKESLKECVTEETCKSVEKDGFKVTFDEKRTPKCMSESDQVTNCDQNNNSTGKKEITADSAKGSSTNASGK